MSAGKLLQLRSVSRVAGLDLFRFRQGQLVKEDPLKLRLGVHIEILPGEFLHRALEGCGFLPELGVELLKIAAVNENAVMLHSENETGLLARLRTGRLFVDGYPEVTTDRFSQRVISGGARLKQVSGDLGVAIQALHFSARREGRSIQQLGVVSELL